MIKKIDINSLSFQNELENTKEFTKDVLKKYTIVFNPDDFIDIEKLKQNNPKLKIVSLCPLRYGLGWSYD